MSEAAAAGGSAAAAPAATEAANHLKRKSSDIGWEWGRLCDPNDKNKVKCLFCGQESTAGINRLKQHLAHKGTSIVKCPKVPEEVKQKCIRNLDEIAKKKKGKQEHDKEVRENVQVSTGQDEVIEVESLAGSSSTPRKLGPMDKFTCPIDPKLTPAEAKRQQNINEALWKERTHQVQQYVARWVYTHAIPFNACDNDEFKEMVEAIGQFGPGFQPPYYSYNNPAIFSDPTVVEKFVQCAETFYYGDDDRAYRAVNVDWEIFHKRQGNFSKKMARSCERFEFNPASWWRLYGGGAPDLQNMAIKILSLTSSASGCERNWSTFEQHHTKRRNRLTAERLNSLVFIQFNNRLLSKKEKIKRKSNYEVLLSSEASEAQGFFFEGGDAHALVHFRDEEDELEMPETGIPWSVLGEAMGTSEQLQPRRSARVAREVDEDEWESESEDPDYQDDDIAYEDDDDEEAILNCTTFAE